MREILFRGKRIDNGEWTEGGYKHEKAGEYFTAVFIIEHLMREVWENHRVDPSTLGQYTGLTDKKGRKIFEGDIVKAPFCGKKLHTFIIRFVEGGFFAVPTDHEIDKYRLWKFHIATENQNMKVIGNIHDNPELLKED